MFDNFERHLNGRIQQILSHLGDEARACLNGISQHRQYKKKDVLLQQGQICRSSFYILKGVARKFYRTEDKEVTTELFFDDDLAISFASYSLQTPAFESLEALTDLEVSVTHHRDFQMAKEKFPQLKDLDLALTEHYACWLEKRLFQLQTQDATQRYRSIMEHHPRVLQHVPLTIIASYLNISLETLSRIRAKV